MTSDGAPFLSTGLHLAYSKWYNSRKCHSSMLNSSSAEQSCTRMLCPCWYPDLAAIARSMCRRYQGNQMTVIKYVKKYISIYKYLHICTCFHIRQSFGFLN